MAINPMVDTAANVKKCMKKPLMSQPMELYGIFPVMREAKKRGLGMTTFMRSVVAKAAMKRLVVVLKRSFLNTTAITRTLPTRERIRSKQQVKSTTAISPRLKGISPNISHEMKSKIFNKRTQLLFGPRANKRSCLP